MKFRSLFPEKKRFVSSSGSRFFKTYIRSYNEDDRGSLVLSGTEDVFDSIQKASQGNIIEDLIRRASSGDDQAVLDPNNLAFGDFTHTPKDMLEAHSMFLESKKKFEGLPVELRKQFGNSFTDFLKHVGDGSVSEFLNSKLANGQQVQKQPLTTFSSEEVAKLKKLIVGGNNNA